MKSADLLREVKVAWFAVERAGQHSDLLAKCVEASETVERNHRRMGRSIASARYSLSVEWTARYFVAKIVSREIQVPRTWSEFAAFRADFPLCQALREEIARSGKLEALERTEAFNAIDYAGDISIG